MDADKRRRGGWGEWPNVARGVRGALHVAPIFMDVVKLQIIFNLDSVGGVMN